MELMGQKPQMIKTKMLMYGIEQGIFNVWIDQRGLRQDDISDYHLDLNIIS